MALEARCQHRILGKHDRWVLDSSVWPDREFQRYWAVGKVQDRQFIFPHASERGDNGHAVLDFAAIGLSSVATIGTLADRLEIEQDYKANFRNLWEPELATFATLVCTVLHRWGHRVALLTSIGDDQRRTGAGDVLRTALMHQLLEPRLDERPIRDKVAVAQHAAYRWLTRAATDSYLDSFPPPFSEIENDYRDTVAMVVQA